jgi:flagellar protein FlgJ
VEYEDGSPRKQTAQFRSYATPEAAFKDYVGFLKTQPRYAQALNHGGDATRFAHGLQKAGYATDPAYAEKIGRIARGHLMTLAMTSVPKPRQLEV